MGQIRFQQLVDYGASHAVTLTNPDFGLFAAAVGAHYELIGSDIEKTVRSAIRTGGVWVIEVPVGSTYGIVRTATVARARETARRIIGGKILSRLKHLLVRR